ncbi:MAG: hypothetical protein ABI743_03680 [bacterium]
MSTASVETATGRLDAALRRCLLAIDQFGAPGPPHDLEDDDAEFRMRLTVTKHFHPDELEPVLADEGRLCALTQWALFALLAKPWIVQYHSPRVRWARLALPSVSATEDRADRVALVWSWEVRFLAPRDSGNVYLEVIEPMDPQLQLFE